jgi:hypothetical protein
MHSHDAVVHLSPVPIPLSPHSDRLRAALGHSRLIHDTDGLGVSVVFGHNLLAPIPQLLFIPLDRFEKPL